MGAPRDGGGTLREQPAPPPGRPPSGITLADPRPGPPVLRVDPHGRPVRRVPPWPQAPRRSWRRAHHGDPGPPPAGQLGGHRPQPRQPRAAGRGRRARRAARRRPGPDPGRLRRAGHRRRLRGRPLPAGLGGLGRAGRRGGQRPAGPAAVAQPGPRPRAGRARDACCCCARSACGSATGSCWPIALAAAGSAVIWARSDDRDRARWARIPGNPIEAMFTGRVGLIRIVVGGLLVASGLGLGFANTGADLAAAGDALLGVAITLIGLGLIFGPWATRLAAPAGRGAPRAHPLRGARRDGRPPARLGAADPGPDPAQRRRPAARSSAWPAGRSASCGPGCTARPVPPRRRAAAGRRGDRRPGSSSATTCRSRWSWSATPRSTTPPRRWSTRCQEAASTPPGTRGRPRSSVYVEVGAGRAHRVRARPRARASTPTRSRPTGAASPSRSAAGSQRHGGTAVIVSPAPARAPRSSCRIRRATP